MKTHDVRSNTSAGVSRALSSAGRPLDAATRSFMEPRFDRDFGTVRIHDDASAAESAGSLGAQAYTVGQHVVFNRGYYAPQSGVGRRLIAHELAHTIQQPAQPRRMPTQMTSPGDASERQAERAGDAVMRGEAVPSLSPEPRLSRQLLPDASTGAPDGGASRDGGVSDGGVSRDGGAPDGGVSRDGGVPDGGAATTGPAPAAGPAPVGPAAPPPAAPLRLLRVEVEPAHRGHFPQIPGTGAGTHWVGVASATAPRPFVRAVFDSAVSPTDPRVAGLTWSGPGVAADPANGLRAEVERMAGERRVTARLGAAAASTTVWSVFASITATAGPAPAFAPSGPTAVAGVTAAMPGGAVNFSAQIFPARIITAGDHPALEGANDTPPSGGLHWTGGALANGADHHWDFSRKMRTHVINPAAIPLASFVVPGDPLNLFFAAQPIGFPARWETGNDDRATGDETNDPYTAPMTSGDGPGMLLNDAAGVDGDTFEIRLQFQEFVRLELARSWWVVSQMFLWRNHLRVRRVGGHWVDNGTDAAADNAGF